MNTVKTLLQRLGVVPQTGPAELRQGHWLKKAKPVEPRPVRATGHMTADQHADKYGKYGLCDNKRWIINWRTASRASVQPHFITRTVKSTCAAEHYLLLCFGTGVWRPFEAIETAGIKEGRSQKKRFLGDHKAEKVRREAGEGVQSEPT